MYEYGGAQCMSMEGPSVYVWRGPVYECRGGQCMSVEGANV